ncbi:MAG: hypothetical protein CMI16_08715 [Opitutaceae bacterium]|jgi:hypothetical protein|nr:hypothetical protein [Opitutaceae bacterium]
MSFPEFLRSLNQEDVPTGIGVPLQAMREAARDKWDEAHRLVQDDSSADAAWVHAYLHRQEGDVGNADYWYARAEKKRPEASLEQEWEAISSELLDRAD